MHVFCLTRGPTRSWRNGDAHCCQLINIADPFSDFFPLKKAPKPYLVSENRRYCLASKRSCFPSTRTHLSLSLSLCLSLCICSVSVQRAAEKKQRFNSVKLRYNVACFSNFTWKYSRNHSTAIVFILCVFISSDDIMQFNNNYITVLNYITFINKKQAQKLHIIYIFLFFTLCHQKKIKVNSYSEINNSLS